MGTLRIVPLLLAVLVCGPAPADEVAPFAAANRFACDLYAHLAKEEGNLFFSPFSVTSAMAMTYAGARGQTAREMEQVLHVTPNVHGPLGGLIDELNAAGQDRFELSVANALWGGVGEKFLPPFLDLVKNHYSAGLQRVDFAHADAAAAKINGWVEDRTRERIQRLIPPKLLTPNTVLVLTNALYFKGAWLHKFQARATKDLPFHIAGGAAVDVATMRQTSTFRYGEADGTRMLEMPYRGRRISMVILLPKAGTPATLDASALQQGIDAMKPRPVSVFLPRFKMTSSFRLNDALSDMGMPTAFGGGADFSGMNGARDLFIAHVLHKAFVDVNEWGTEAAAATAVIMGRKGRPRQPVEFRVDRPFLFLLRDMKSGSILFLGRVADPRG